MNTPVAVGELLEEKFVKCRAVELTQSGLGIGAGGPPAPPAFDLREQQTGKAAHQGKRRNPRKNVPAAQRIVVEFSMPLDMGLQWHLDALLSHGTCASGEDFFIKSVQHMNTQIIPVATPLVAGSQSTWLRLFFPH